MGDGVPLFSAVPIRRIWGNLNKQQKTIAQTGLISKGVVGQHMVEGGK